ncbi:MAG: hypothetical protein H6974_05000 [Gammaproteobacteria bacterium]|nr:hypothetical protein [Gammaproteobacteria bacterium]MCP5196139.1 hypothetical protein [Gammaproteobacteria bacterium]
MSDPNALHPDQHRFKNLTNDQVRRLQKIMDFAVISIDHAIKRLQPMISPPVGCNPAERWNRENYHCWWGEFDAQRSSRTAQLCVTRYQAVKGKLNTSKLRFKLRKEERYTNVAPYWGWRIYLGANFFRSRSLDSLSTLIHELFHLIGLVDLRYSRDACVTLAQTLPILARGNPDNYAYYALDCYRNQLSGASHLAMDDPYCQLARQDHGSIRLPGT